MAKVTGQVVSVSAEGNLVTDISVGDLGNAPRDERVSIKSEGHATAGIYALDHGQPEMTFIAIEGGSGCLELLLVGDDASRFLGIQAGSAVTVQW